VLGRQRLPIFMLERDRFSAMPFQSNPLGEILLWTGWLTNGWRWAFSASFRRQKRARWRELPSVLAVLDAMGSCFVWVTEISLVLFLAYLALRG
jgi:hypothetical protein